MGLCAVYSHIKNNTLILETLKIMSTFVVLW